MFGALVIAACFPAARRAEEGRGAFIRWAEPAEQVWTGGEIYRTAEDPSGADEGFPTPPLMAMLLWPFEALGPGPGAVVWTLFKGVLAGWILVLLMGVLSRSGPAPPSIAWPILVVLLAQVVHLDLTHANTNLLVLVTLGAALVALDRDRPWLGGHLLGLAVVLKLTPLLFLPWLVWQRRWRVAVAMLLGILVYAEILPGLLLGFERNHDLLAAWYDQMIHPFVAGKQVTYMQTGYMNQSLTGVLHRVLGDGLAVAEQPQRGVEAMRVGFVAWETRTVTWIVRIASVIAVALLCWGTRRRDDARRGAGLVRAFAQVTLVMLFVSERSWRTHYVTLAFGLAYLLQIALDREAARKRRHLAGFALVTSLVTHHGIFDELFGKRVALALESYGVYLLGGLVVFAVLLSLAPRPRPSGSSPAPHPGP